LPTIGVGYRGLDRTEVKGILEAVGAKTEVVLEVCERLPSTQRGSLTIGPG